MRCLGKRTWLTLALLVTAACAAPPAQTPGAARTAEPVAGSPPPHPTPLSTIQAADAWRMIELTMAAASLLLEQPAAELQVEHVEARDWPDSSLGCPEQGVTYDYVLTPGYLVIVSTRDQRLEYHTDTRATVVLCHADPVPSRAGEPTRTPAPF